MLTRRFTNPLTPTIRRYLDISADGVPSKPKARPQLRPVGRGAVRDGPVGAPLRTRPASREDQVETRSAARGISPAAHEPGHRVTSGPSRAAASVDDRLTRSTPANAAFPPSSSLNNPLSKPSRTAYLRSASASAFKESEAASSSSRPPATRRQATEPISIDSKPHLLSSSERSGSAFSTLRTITPATSSDSLRRADASSSVASSEPSTLRQRVKERVNDFERWAEEGTPPARRVSLRAADLALAAMVPLPDDSPVLSKQTLPSNRGPADSPSLSVLVGRRHASNDDSFAPLDPTADALATETPLPRFKQPSQSASSSPASVAELISRFSSPSDATPTRRAKLAQQETPSSGTPTPGDAEARRISPMPRRSPLATTVEEAPRSLKRKGEDMDLVLADTLTETPLPKTAPRLSQPLIAFGDSPVQLKQTAAFVFGASAGGDYTDLMDLSLDAGMITEPLQPEIGTSSVEREDEDEGSVGNDARSLVDDSELDATSNFTVTEDDTVVVGDVAVEVDVADLLGDSEEEGEEGEEEKVVEQVAEEGEEKVVEQATEVVEQADEVEQEAVTAVESAVVVDVVQPAEVDAQEEPQPAITSGSVEPSAKPPVSNTEDLVSAEPPTAPPAEHETEPDAPLIHLTPASSPQRPRTSLMKRSPSSPARLAMPEVATTLVFDLDSVDQTAVAPAPVNDALPPRCDEPSVEQPTVKPAKPLFTAAKKVEAAKPAVTRSAARLGPPTRRPATVEKTSFRPVSRLDKKATPAPPRVTGKSSRPPTRPASPTPVAETSGSQSLSPAKQARAPSRAAVNAPATEAAQPPSTEATRVKPKASSSNLFKPTAATAARAAAAAVARETRAEKAKDKEQVLPKRPASSQAERAPAPVPRPAASRPRGAAFGSTAASRARAEAAAALPPSKRQRTKLHAPAESFKPGRGRVNQSKAAVLGSSNARVRPRPAPRGKEHETFPLPGPGLKRGSGGDVTSASSRTARTSPTAKVTTPGRTLAPLPSDDLTVAPPHPGLSPSSSRTSRSAASSARLDVTPAKPLDPVLTPAHSANVSASSVDSGTPRKPGESPAVAHSRRISGIPASVTRAMAAAAAAKIEHVAEENEEAEAPKPSEPVNLSTPLKRDDALSVVRHDVATPAKSAASLLARLNDERRALTPRDANREER